MPQQVDTRWFRDRLADCKLSQRGLARAMGLDPAAVSLTLRGKREMKIAEAAQIARLLGVPADDVMEHAGVRVASKNVLVPVGATMDATAEVHFDLTSGESVPHPGGDIAEMVCACRCQTEGSEMSHMDGWLLFWHPPGVRRPVVVRAPEKRGRLCGQADARLTARALAPDHPARHHPRCRGRVGQTRADGHPVALYPRHSGFVPGFACCVNRIDVA
jgi:transcriptional regulator with XRE-family HTH domain